MAGPISALQIFRTRSFKAYKDQIRRLLMDRQRPKASDAKDAGALKPSWGVAELLAPARNALAAHIARKDDPHKETIESINSYSEETLSGNLATKVPNSVVPVSSFGVLDRMSAAQVSGMWTYPTSGWTLTANRVVRVVMSGTVYEMPVTTLDLSSVVEDPSNATFNIFVRLRFGKISYEARTDSPPEASGVMFLGSIKTGAVGITSKSFLPVIRIDTYRLSTTPLGSVIPVTTGTMDQPNKLPSTWKPL